MSQAVETTTNRFASGPVHHKEHQAPKESSPPSGRLSAILQNAQLARNLARHLDLRLQPRLSHRLVARLGQTLDQRLGLRLFRLID
ncbi:MAG: hypothetical protein R6X13_06065 [bacterium]